MGFPENILTKDEKVVRSLHPHWLTIFKPIMLGLLVIAVVVVVALLTPDRSPWDVVEWVVIGVGIIAVLVVVVVPFLKWRTTHYVITNKRVVVRRGILTKSGQDIALSKITDVSFRQSVLDRLTKAGSLNIETAGDSPDEDFSSIPRSNEVQQLLNHLIEEDAAAKGGYGGAAHRGHQMMGQRSYDDPPVAPPNDQSNDGRSGRQPGTPADAQQPTQWEQPAQRGQQFEQPRFEEPRFEQPQFEQPRFEQPQFEKPQGGPNDPGRGGSPGGQWETPPTR